MDNMNNREDFKTNIDEDDDDDLMRKALYVSALVGEYAI